MLNTNESHLIEWKKLLNAEGIAELDSELEDFEWFTILDKDNQVIVIFEIINVLNQRAKNLKIRFNPFSLEKSMPKIIEII